LIGNSLPDLALSITISAQRKSSAAMPLTSIHLLGLAEFSAAISSNNLVSKFVRSNNIGKIRMQTGHHRFLYFSLFSLFRNEPPVTFGRALTQTLASAMLRALRVATGDAGIGKIGMGTSKYL
jgi:hypothetical protein